MTINIYSVGKPSDRMEFFNNGEFDVNELPIKMDFGKKKEQWFNLSKEDAKELIKYLRKEFKLSLGEI